MGKLYGLIGYKLSHSFSKQYFEEKFLKEQLADHRYELFEIGNVQEIKRILEQNPNLDGLNVTIPYKESIIPYLDHLDKSAEKVGAVNVIKIENSSLTGYNSDFYGFQTSLFKWLPIDNENLSALILGTGGAAKAVKAVLTSNNIPFTMVSRRASIEAISYGDLKNSNLITENKLVVNTTPLGMAPNLDRYPDIPYKQIGKNHYVYDLIYNPSETMLLKKAGENGATIKNGLEMLELQAGKSWEIWTS